MVDLTMNDSNATGSRVTEKSYTDPQRAKRKPKSGSLSCERKSQRLFEFFTRLHLTQLLGLKAFNLPELLHYIRTVPRSSIYHHTHRFLQQHIYLSPEPPNDFAYWIMEDLGDERLREKLASIDTMQDRSGLKRGNRVGVKGFGTDSPDAANPLFGKPVSTVSVQHVR